MKRLVVAIVFLFMLIFIQQDARASISMFGYTFDDNAFSDDAKLISGDVSPRNGWNGGEMPDIPSALNGSSLNTYIEGRLTESTSSPFMVEAIYKDNYLFNGSGADLTVWERYTPEGFNLSIFDSSNNTWTNELFFQPTLVGYLYEEHAYREVNLALVDFDQFGLASDVAISRIRISSNSTSYSPDIAALGGLNSRTVVPEPVSCLLLSFGLLGMAFRRKQ